MNLRTVTSIEFKKIYSTRLNFEGGMMIITGLFDRKTEEIVTIKMNRTDYKLLAKLLKETGLWSNKNNDTYCYTKLQYDQTNL